MPPKVVFFAWAAALGKILTAYNLRKMIVLEWCRKMILMEEGSMLDPELELHVEVLLHDKDCHIKIEGEAMKRKYHKRHFEKVRSATRVLTRATKFSL